MPAHDSDPSFSAPDGWLEYADWRGRPATVAGRLLVRRDVASPGLGNRRDVLLHVPPSLSSGRASRDRRWPVLYLHDGQNLFDEGTSAFGDWRLDETLQDLGENGLEAIAVGIPNAEAARPRHAQRRPDEYSPYEDGGVGGNAEDYLGLIADIVKPLVDAAFPTHREPAATGIAGSSLGGLVSLYGLVARPDAFGFAGVLSPALQFGGGRALVEVAPALRPGPRIYLDVGGCEGSHHDGRRQQDEVSRRYLQDARALRDVLVENGFVPGEDLLYVEDLEAVHHESAWARRTAGMLRFLLRPWESGPALTSISTAGVPDSP